jgi:hypothetical protein
MPVLKQISPVVVPIFPNAFPRNTVPSSNNKIAGFFSILSGIILNCFANKVIAALIS